MIDGNTFIQEKCNTIYRHLSCHKHIFVDEWNAFIKWICCENLCWTTQTVGGGKGNRIERLRDCLSFCLSFVFSYFYSLWSTHSKREAMCHNIGSYLSLFVILSGDDDAVRIVFSLLCKLFGEVIVKSVIIVDKYHICGFYLFSPIVSDIACSFAYREILVIVITDYM